MNSLFLSIISSDRFDNDPRWLTFNQAIKMGYSIRKGEKGSVVFSIFYIL